jgi:aminoglycoside phosphotransferase family enzyme/predicted kinase
MLFFVGERVYKMRKPVQFGFLDFRQPAARRADCEREVALNRRLSPDVYLGVADLEMEGQAIDHLVVMRRLPEGRRLAALLRDGVCAESWLHQIAETLAAFHARAERSAAISDDATGEALLALWQENFSETDPFVGTGLDEGIEEEIRTLATRWIEGRTALLDGRIAAGRVCDGHGDLQSDDIFCLDDGVRVLDCIEFSDRLRHGDVCSDVAFLAMDLEAIGCSDAADMFLRDYQLLADDAFPETLTHHYIAYRAYIRAKVACLRARQLEGGDDGKARRLQTLALDHLRRARVRLVLIGGPPGSGKSTLAAGLANATGWTVIRSDEVRREGSIDHPESTTASTPGSRQDRYDSVATAGVYGELLRRAEHRLSLGESVVLDASWIDSSWRERARDVADRTCSDLLECRCDVDPGEAARRITRRLAERTDISEATPEISRMMSRSMDAWPSAVDVDTSELDPKAALERVLETL